MLHGCIKQNIYHVKLLEYFHKYKCLSFSNSPENIYFKEQWTQMIC